MNKNNKGFSLIELLIATVLLTLALSAFMSLMVSSAKMFSKGNLEVDLQEEAQITANQINDLICDAQVYVLGSAKDLMVCNNDKIIYLYVTDDSKLMYSEYAWPSGAAKKKETVLASGFADTVKTQTPTLAASLMAKNVKSLGINTSNLAGKNVITTSVIFKNDKISDRVFQANHTIFCRNLLGTGTPSAVVSPDDKDYDEDLLLVRYKTYDLKKLFGIDSFTKNGTSGNYYYAAATSQVSIASSVSASASDGGTYLTCKKDGKDYVIRLHFDAVELGLPSSAGIQTVLLATGNVENIFNYIATKGFYPGAAGMTYRVVVEGRRIGTGVALSTTLPENPTNGTLDNAFETAGCEYYRYYIENCGYEKLTTATAAEIKPADTSGGYAGGKLFFDGSTRIRNGKYNGSSWGQGDSDFGYINAKILLRSDDNSDNLIIWQNGQMTHNSFDWTKSAYFATVYAYYNGALLGSATVRFTKEGVGVSGSGSYIPSPPAS